MPTESPGPTRHPTHSWSEFAMRSLLPLAAVLLLASTLVIGPWGFLLATVAFWRIVSRTA